MGIVLEANNIIKNYGTLQVVKGASLQINSGEIVSIVGSSGAGKSTLLHILGTLEKADSGSVKIRNESLSSLSSKQLAEFRNKHIGFVFQFHHLLPEFTALENVCIPGWINNKNKKEVEKKATELLELLGLKDRLKHQPSKLSGGEQQRVAVARSLINNPSIVLADEPTGNLDTENANLLHSTFEHLSSTLKQSFLIVTHNENLAQRSHRILHMQDGKFI